MGAIQDSQKGVLESLGSECIVPEVHVHLRLACTQKGSWDKFLPNVMHSPCAHGSTLVILPEPPCMTSAISCKGPVIYFEPYHDA